MLSGLLGEGEGDTDPWLLAGIGSSSVLGIHIAHPETAGLQGTHSWAGNPPSFGGTHSQGTGPGRSGDRAAHRAADSGHPHSLRQETSRENRY